jgi:hypothetical protein
MLIGSGVGVAVGAAVRVGATGSEGVDFRTGAVLAIVTGAGSEAVGARVGSGNEAQPASKVNMTTR